MDPKARPLRAILALVAVIVIAWLLVVPLAVDPSVEGRSGRWSGCLGLPSTPKLATPPARPAKPWTEATPDDDDDEAEDDAVVAEEPAAAEDGAGDDAAGEDPRWANVRAVAPLTGRFAPAGNVARPTWSPNGKYLTWEVRSADHTDLVVGNAQGLTVSKATPIRLPGGPTSAYVDSADWLDNPSLVIFRGNERLYFYAPGGASASEMIHKTVAPEALSEPDIAKDRLTFVRGADAIGVWDRGPGKVLNFPLPGARRPRLTADRTAVLADHPGDAGDRDVVRIDLATGAITPVVAGPGDQFGAVSLPTGVVAVEARGAAPQVVVDDGSKRRVVAATPALGDARLAVSDDGGVLAWADTVRQEIVLTRLSDGLSSTLALPLRAPAEVALDVQGDTARVAFTYDEGGVRQLAIADVSGPWSDVRPR